MATPVTEDRVPLKTWIAVGGALLGAFLAVRRSDAAWAEEKETEDVLAAWRWRY